jgi:hypothetical protein
MQESENTFYDRAIRRIRWIILGLGLAGTGGVSAIGGVWSGFAFLIGAAVSYLSFSGWQRLAGALSPDAKKPSSWFIVRLVALLAVAWVIIKILRLNMAAAVGGLLVSSAAVILELVYELIYART